MLHYEKNLEDIPGLKPSETTTKSYFDDSGLDSSSSLQCVTLLRDIARSGRTVKLKTLSITICKYTHNYIIQGGRYHPPAQFEITGTFRSSLRRRGWFVHVPGICQIFSPLSQHDEFELS
jgi:hypothetical protein